MAGGTPDRVGPAAPQTATGNSGPQTIGDHGSQLHVLVAVSAVAGTSPSFTFAASTYVTN